MAAIEVRDLVRVFAEGQVRAVDGVSLDVEAGEVFGFLGPNGAGKTTAVRVMTTLLRPTSGTARVAGIDVTQDPAGVRRRIGVALQEVGLDPLQTARELLTLQAQLYRSAHPRRRADELLEIVGLTEAADRRVGNFSGGMKRRLDLAAGLVHEPEILFLDEPTTGLDPASRKNVWEEVRRLNDSGVTIFLTTQYLEEADVLADRLAIIEHGRIVAQGTPRELKASISADIVSVSVADGDQEQARGRIASLAGVDRVDAEDGVLHAYVEDGAAVVPAVVRELDQAGIGLREISLRQPTLDDVFLAATGQRLEGAAEDASPSTSATADGRRRHRPKARR